jgi:hypothetical protein
MSTNQSEKTPADRYARGADGLLLDPAAARREARRGWIMITSVFVGGGLLVALAALVT